MGGVRDWSLIHAYDVTWIFPCDFHIHKFNKVVGFFFCCVEFFCVVCVATWCDSPILLVKHFTTYFLALRDLLLTDGSMWLASCSMMCIVTCILYRASTKLDKLSLMVVRMLRCPRWIVQANPFVLYVTTSFLDQDHPPSWWSSWIGHSALDAHQPWSMLDERKLLC